MNSPLAVVVSIFVLACNATPGARQPSTDESSPVTMINAEAAKSPIDVLKLRGNVSVLMGSGGNISVLSQPSGKLMVDCGIAVSQEKISRALSELGPGPVTYLVNTHWHWDHTDGNAWVWATGATIVGHENVAARLSTTTRVEDWKHTFLPVPPSARPTELFSQDKTMRFGDEVVIMKYYGRAHTEGDISVYFTNADVLATGDTFWNGVYPFIDIVAGGSIDGMIRAADANIAMVKEQTIVVGGHGPVGARAELVEYRDMLVGIRSSVAALKGRGKSLDETVAAHPTATYDAKWGQFVIHPNLFTSLVYRSLPAASASGK